MVITNDFVLGCAAGIIVGAFALILQSIAFDKYYKQMRQIFLKEYNDLSIRYRKLLSQKNRTYNPHKQKHETKI